MTSIHDGPHGPPPADAATDSTAEATPELGLRLFDALLLLPSDAVPERWRPRAVPYCGVWLSADEVAALDIHDDGRRHLPPELRAVLPLVAAGLSANKIADRLHMSSRTVQRRLRQLRRAYGVSWHAELVAALALPAERQRLRRPKPPIGTSASAPYTATSAGRSSAFLRNAIKRSRTATTL